MDQLNPGLSSVCPLLTGSKQKLKWNAITVSSLGYSTAVWLHRPTDRSRQME